MLYSLVVDLKWVNDRGAAHESQVNVLDEKGVVATQDFLDPFGARRHSHGGVVSGYVVPHSLVGCDIGLLVRDEHQLVAFKGHHYRLERSSRLNHLAEGRRRFWSAMPDPRHSQWASAYVVP